MWSIMKRTAWTKVLYKGTNWTEVFSFKWIELKALQTKSKSIQMNDRNHETQAALWKESLWRQWTYFCWIPRWGKITPNSWTAAAAKAEPGGRGVGTSWAFSKMVNGSYSNVPPPEPPQWSFKQTENAMRFKMKCAVTRHWLHINKAISLMIRLWSDLFLYVVLIHILQSRAQQCQVLSVAQGGQQVQLSTCCDFWPGQIVQQLLQHRAKALWANTTKPQ